MLAGEHSAQLSGGTRSRRVARRVDEGDAAKDKYGEEERAEGSF